MGEGAYTGPVCYVGHDHPAADGRPLTGGWHYSVVDDGHGGEMPGEPLYLDHETGEYRYAAEEDQSWRDRHHQQLKIVAMSGSVGEPRTPEEFEATHRHLDELEQRLADEGLHPHEHDHILRTPEEIRVVRGWLRQAEGTQ